MSAMEKSDLPEVARKRANKAASAAAEPVERRGQNGFVRRGGTPLLIRIKAALSALLANLHCLQLAPSICHEKESHHESSRAQG